MKEDEYIDFKKEFEEFKKELEKSKPLFEEELVFDDDFNLINEINSDSKHTSDFEINSDSKDNSNLEINANLDDYSENFENLNAFDQMNDYFYDTYYPEITIETDDFKLNLTIKKDYSKIEDLDERKEEFFNDLKEFFEEFKSTEESTELMKYYDNK